MKRSIQILIFKYGTLYTITGYYRERWLCTAWK